MSEGEIPPGHRGEIMWAPWRSTYVGRETEGEYEKPQGCPFCRLPAGDDDRAALILHRGEQTFVIMNLYPYNNGHLMVVPYDHVDDLRALDAAALAEMTDLIGRSESVLETTMTPEGFNIGINQGRAAGAGIADHLHAHVVPRWIGDNNFMPVMNDIRVIPQHLEETYDLLRERFRS